MERVSLKIVGSSGQGIDSIGEVLAKSLKRSGYSVFGYREYPSLIKGGIASYQIDFSNESIESSTTTVDILICLNHHPLQKCLCDVKPGGIIIHSTAEWKFPKEHLELITKRQLKIIELPIETIITELKTKPILSNTLLTGFVWSVLGLDAKLLETVLCAKFQKKKDLLEINRTCLERGALLNAGEKKVSINLPKPLPKFEGQLLITGSKAMGLGAVHAGVRLYAGYPMTPSSPLLSFIAELQNATGMIIKQAEDEITAAQIVSGAMHAGTRALTATSGGGFDLMSETLSLNGIIENPTVFVLAQRPGPATGLPTWTAQGDLLLSVFTGHGEFTRCVMSVSNAADSFDLIAHAFNIAEEYQISVILLTDKQIAEALYTTPPFTGEHITLKRGKLITNRKELAMLKASDRYDPSSENGISPRWLPGSEAPTYCAQGDEHNGEGSVIESSENAIAQMQKRMKKMEALKASLPEPELFGSQTPEILLVGWGSTKSVVLDAIKDPRFSVRPIGYLHYSYLWPLKTEKFLSLTKTAKEVILIEGNYGGQLGTLLTQESGYQLQKKILKYDGRPFFVDELTSAIFSKLS